MVYAKILNIIIKSKSLKIKETQKEHIFMIFWAITTE